MTTKSSPRRRAGYSDLAIPPGEGLQEETEYRGISPQQLADRCGEPVEYIQRVFTGQQEITSAFAKTSKKSLASPPKPGSTSNSSTSKPSPTATKRAPAEPVSPTKTGRVRQEPAPAN